MVCEEKLPGQLLSPTSGHPDWLTLHCYSSLRLSSLVFFLWIYHVKVVVEGDPLLFFFFFIVALAACLLSLSVLLLLRITLTLCIYLVGAVRSIIEWEEHSSLTGSLDGNWLTNNILLNHLQSYHRYYHLHPYSICNPSKTRLKQQQQQTAPTTLCLFFYFIFVFSLKQEVRERCAVTSKLLLQKRTCAKTWTTGSFLVRLFPRVRTPRSW